MKGTRREDLHWLGPSPAWIPTLSPGLRWRTWLPSRAGSTDARSGELVRGATMTLSRLVGSVPSVRRPGRWVARSAASDAREMGESMHKGGGERFRGRAAWEQGRVPVGGRATARSRRAAAGSERAGEARLRGHKFQTGVFVLGSRCSAIACAEPDRLRCSSPSTTSIVLLLPCRPISPLATLLPPSQSHTHPCPRDQETSAASSSPTPSRARCCSAREVRPRPRPRRPCLSSSAALTTAMAGSTQQAGVASAARSSERCSVSAA